MDLGVWTTIGTVVFGTAYVIGGLVGHLRKGKDDEDRNAIRKRIDELELERTQNATLRDRIRDLELAAASRDVQITELRAEVKSRDEKILELISKIEELKSYVMMETVPSALAARFDKIEDLIKGQVTNASL